MIKTNLNSNNIVERIKAIAKQHFFSYGLKTITMDELANGSGVSKKTIYQYYMDKDSLVHAVVVDQIQSHERLLSSSQSIANGAIDEVIIRDIELFGLWTDIHHSFFYELEKYYPDAWLELENYSVKMRNLIIGNMKRGQKEGLYRKDMNVVLIAELYMHQLRSLLRSQFEATQKLSKECLVKEITMLHLRSIATKKGKTLLDNYSKPENEYQGNPCHRLLASK